MITLDTPCWWHGCWLTSGHHLSDPRGYVDDRATPLAGLCAGLDTGYAPRRHKRTGSIVYIRQCGGFDEARRALFYASDELPQGQFLRHYFGRDLTVLAWWDRAQGDTRGNCNSCFIVQGDHTSTEMLEWFPRRFSLQARCMKEGGPVGKKERVEPFDLVEVFVTPSPIYGAQCPACKRTIYETQYPNPIELRLFNHPAVDHHLGNQEPCEGSGSLVRWEPTGRLS